VQLSYSMSVRAKRGEGQVAAVFPLPVFLPLPLGEAQTPARLSPSPTGRGSDPLPVFLPRPLGEAQTSARLSPSPTGRGSDLCPSFSLSHWERLRPLPVFLPLPLGEAQTHSQSFSLAHWERVGVRVLDEPEQTLCSTPSLFANGKRIDRGPLCYPAYIPATTPCPMTPCPHHPGPVTHLSLRPTH